VVGGPLRRTAAAGFAAWRGGVYGSRVRRDGRRAAALVLAGVLAAGCATLHRPWAHLGEPPPRFDEEGFARKDIPTYRLPATRPSDTVIGAARRYRIRDGDTLLDVARWFDLGYNEIVEANPGVDPMIPPVGAEVRVPTEWVLPCCTREGIVVNIPEMRLYYFRPAPEDPATTIVETHPVGLGRSDWRTPRGRFRVARKTVNPTWYVPESIRREHIRDRGDGRRVIPGGDPDNPLGKYRLQLSRSLYGIHGTNIPWGVGMEVTHGCVRLYPEDIERLYPLVPIGTPVEFTYQAVKVGTRGADIYVEVHRDIYRYQRSLAADSRTAFARQHVTARVDQRLLDDALKSADGVPIRVSPDGGSARRPAG
jgi:L,D-transpeptidase ErfK/SrfK